MRDTAVFVGSWLRAPGKTGAVWPSSRFLARRLASVLEGHAEPTVAELGPGTGPTTAQIQHRLRGKGRHVAIDLNEEFVTRLRTRFPDVEVVCESAAELPRILKDRDIGAVDAVISGLPFAAFPEGLQRDILDAVVAALHPRHGVFTTFNYVGSYAFPPGERFRRLLGERFSDVCVRGPEMRNFPPAHVLTARGPRIAA
ncbi:MAG TPA: methyltransferase domain-containing protein [Stackebrandtia sp.]|jgi:phospholipid N-methyltransferase|uniref:class I SAM-dependent methyltransferase n=1 Tax=Stackebrandtia sp. TaxID=2023065 RepID=UPI002D2C5037|nr:methyltransferase domain-containing protein [Stackebrandtia sp.]HZE39923.1 methyltransferase domain-containing protein [Stackebrandtia sp.]